MCLLSGCLASYDSHVASYDSHVHYGSPLLARVGLVGTQQIREGSNLALEDWNSVAAQLQSFKALLVHDESSRRCMLENGDEGAGGPNVLPIANAPEPVDPDSLPPLQARLPS